MTIMTTAASTAAAADYGGDGVDTLNRDIHWHSTIFVDIERFRNHHVCARKPPVWLLEGQMFTAGPHPS